MGNLTGHQIAALLSGQPVAQRWTLRVPLDAAHSAYYDTVIDTGINSGGGLVSTDPAKRRVLRAGSRDHDVWNPSPQVSAQPDAVRYSFEVANHDGYFFVGGSGTAWNPFGLYSARPQECIVVHQIFVWSPTQGAWQEVTHMKFVGDIKEIDHSGSQSAATLASGLRAGAPQTATITCEQQTAETALRSQFTEDDADFDEVNNGTPFRETI